MERTLFAGDHVIINKISYGTKVPQHPGVIPVIGEFFKRPYSYHNLYKSLKPFSHLNREDIVVFKAVDDFNSFLVKRLIGLPGDSIKITDSEVYIGNKKLNEKESYSYNYIDSLGNVFVPKNLSNAEYSNLSNSNYTRRIATSPNPNYPIFPRSEQDNWTVDNYGKLIIPKEGMRIELTQNNIKTYSRLIARFENVDLKKYNKKHYYFTINYYFLMGDNRHNSIDSRSFGLVPESYIQGKVVYVL